MVINKKTISVDIDFENRQSKQDFQKKLYDDLDVLFSEINNVTDNKEDSLGNPGSDHQLLQKDSDGTVRWVNTPPFANFEVFTANGTFTKPANIDRVFIEMWGGGGGGGAGGSSTTLGAGGGGGGYAAKMATITGNLTVTVGAAGTAGAAAAGAGGNGGQTSVTGGGLPANVNAGGGTGGAGSSPRLGGAGGTPGAGADFGINGQMGHGKEENHGGSAQVNECAPGGDSPKGGAGAPGAGPGSGNVAAPDGAEPGGGGGGGGLLDDGGAGAKGRVIIWY